MRLPAVALAALLASTACTSYRALNAPPPSRVATLDNAHDALRISEGVALAFECTTAWGNPCSAGTASVDNPTVATVLPAHLGRLASFVDGTLPPTSYVVVGVKPGETLLRVPGEDPVRVVVVAAVDASGPRERAGGRAADRQLVPANGATASAAVGPTKTK